MQLIPILLLIASLLLLLYALRFLRVWQRAWQRENIILPEGYDIGHYGISLVTAYPSSLRPLSAMIEERYPRSEAILICDMQRDINLFGDAIRRFQLVRVNHDHLEGVRALYRSRQRTHRRIVIVDLPIGERHRSEDIAREVASYGHTLYCEGDIAIETDAAALCINIIASHPIDTSLSLAPLVGAGVRVLPSDASQVERVAVAHPLAWRTKGAFYHIGISSLILASLPVVGGELCPYTLATYIATQLIVLYLVCRSTSEKNLFVRFDTITLNFYRFIVDSFKRIYYLYKRGKSALPRKLSVRHRTSKRAFFENKRSQL